MHRNARLTSFWVAPMASEWFCKISGTQVGPLTSQQLAFDQYTLQAKRLVRGRTALEELYQVMAEQMRWWTSGPAAADAGVDVASLGTMTMRMYIFAKGDYAGAIRAYGELKGLAAEDRCLLVVCPEIRDPANLGTIIRTAAAFGASGLIAGRAGTDPFSRRVLRTSMGTVLRLPIVQTDDWNSALATLHRSGFETIATVLDAAGNILFINRPWREIQASEDLPPCLDGHPGDHYPMKVRSMVGLLPFCAVTVFEGKIAENAQLEQQRMQRNNEEQQTRQRTAGGLRQSALTLFRSGSYQKAITEWQEYLKLEPNSDEAYFYIGASYQDQKQLNTAILNFEKCLALNPNNVLAHLNLGMLYDYHRNNFKQAEEHLRKAKELGGAERYSPERLQSMIQDIQDRARASSVLKTPFAVEHKHTFSSCRGTIQFTEEGMEYRTAETDHSIYESFRGLREFNLKGSELSIRTRNNKRYNFHFFNAADATRIRAWNSATRLIQPEK